MPASRIEIDLAAVDRNLGLIRQCLRGGQDAPRTPGQSWSGGSGGGAGGARNRVSICGVIKQDAYGLGAARVAKRLDSLGVEMLAVYSPDEARALAEAPLETPILVLMPTRTWDRADVLYRLAVRNRLHLTLHDSAQATELAALAGHFGIKIPVHIQVDTGMSRGGCLPDEAAKVVEMVAATPRLTLAGVMTHFSSAGTDDAVTREQARAFRTWLESVRPMLPAAVHIHAANTCATLRSHDLHGTMVRVGQSLFGYGMAEMTDAANVEFATIGSALEPAVRWTSRIVHTQTVPAGWPVGYCRTHTTSRPTKIALVPVGYADGYPIGLANRGQVGLTGRGWERFRTSDDSGSHTPQGPLYAPVIGRVSMDQITLDVTDLPDWATRVGAEVELLSRNPAAPTHLPTLAKAAGTIPHQLLCALHANIERVYLFSTAGDEATVPQHDTAKRIGAGDVVTKMPAEKVG